MLGVPVVVDVIVAAVLVIDATVVDEDDDDASVSLTGSGIQHDSGTHSLSDHADMWCQSWKWSTPQQLKDTWILFQVEANPFASSNEYLVLMPFINSWCNVSLISCR